MGRNTAAALTAGLIAGLTTGLAAFVAAPFVSMARRGTIDSRTREARSAGTAAPAPVADARIVQARHRAATVAGIPAPRPPHPSETGDSADERRRDLPPRDVVVPAARRSPRPGTGPADWTP